MSIPLDVELKKFHLYKDAVLLKVQSLHKNHNNAESNVQWEEKLFLSKSWLHLHVLFKVICSTSLSIWYWYGSSLCNLLVQDWYFVGEIKDKEKG